VIANEADARTYCEAVAGPVSTALLVRFADLLTRENERQNLLAHSSLPQLWQRHIADSVQLLNHVPRGTGEWLDLGSGAGFPGVPIAIAEPTRQVVLVESRRLRAEWLRTSAQILGLRNVTVVLSRLENVETRPAGVISARAFAPLEKLLRLSTRFSTPDTHWVLPKGRSAGQELQEQPARVRAMFHVEPSLTDAQAGILVGRGVL